VRTRKPFLRGNAVRLPFSVVGERADAGAGVGAVPSPTSAYADPSRPVVDGAFNQKPILSAAFVALMGLVLLAIIGLVGWLVLRPGQSGGGLGDAGPPDKPVIVDAKALGPDSVEVSWEPMSGVDGFKVLVSEDAKVMPPTAADGVQSVATVPGLLPNTSYCFSLVAQANGQDSPRSDEKCVRTQPASPTASPTPDASSPPASATASAPSSVPPPGGSDPPGETPPPGTQTSGDPSTGATPDGRFAGGRWIAVPFFAADNAAAEPTARARKDKLDQESIDSFVFRYPQDFPGMTGPVPLRLPSVVLAVGPFDSRAQAEAACPGIIAVTGDPRCFYFQPQP
jgi:Fibronectin type III domain